MQENSNRIPIDTKLLTRLFSKIQVDPNISFNGVPCWLWTAGLSDTGYARFQFKGRALDAHRLVFGMFVSIIPSHLHSDHLCRVRRCINPVHIDPVPCSINILRGVGMAAQHARQTHCVNGHEFTEENTYHRSSNPKFRECRICKNIANQRQAEKRLLNKKPRPIKTHCNKGHLMRPPGPYKHRCLICMRENVRRYRQEKSLLQTEWRKLTTYAKSGCPRRLPLRDLPC